MVKDVIFRNQDYGFIQFLIEFWHTSDQRVGTRGRAEHPSSNNSSSHTFGIFMIAQRIKATSYLKLSRSAKDSTAIAHCLQRRFRSCRSLHP